MDGALAWHRHAGRNPRSGDAYRQEYYAGEAEDMAEILEVGVARSIGLGDYDDVVVTEDWKPLEPEVVEEKWYAPGVGMIYEDHSPAATGRSSSSSSPPAGEQAARSPRRQSSQARFSVRLASSESSRRARPRSKGAFMKRRTKAAAGAVLAVGAAGAGLTVANASGDDGPRTMVRTPRSAVTHSLRRAAAALAYTGEGRVSGSEVDDEESKYEVEVTLDNGGQVDVQLDEGFKVVGSENDGAGEDD